MVIYTSRTTSGVRPVQQRWRQRDISQGSDHCPGVFGSRPFVQRGEEAR